MRKAKPITLCLLALPALWFLAHSVAVASGGLHDDARPADVIVVLGNRVERDGTPSLRLRERLDKALAVYRQGLAPRIIVSGGLGDAGYLEAEVMRAYLTARGVAPEHVIADNDGVDTYRSAINARRLMAERGMRSAIVVTQYYHIPRARLAFARAGIRPVYSAHAEVKLSLREPYSLLREFVAYYFYLLRPFPAPFTSS